MYTRTNKFLLFARKYNTPFFGYGKTNDDELDKEKGWDMNTELRREGDKKKYETNNGNDMGNYLLHYI